MSFIILVAAGHRLATHAAPEDATYAGRTTHQDRLGWVVRGDGVVVLVHPRVGKRSPPWPPPEDAPANAVECPVRAALWRPSTTVEIATETGLPRREVKAALLAYLTAGRVEWTEHVWSRVEAGQAASETPRQVGLGYQPCQRHHPTTTPPASPATPPPCRQRPRRPWSSRRSTTTAAAPSTSRSPTPWPPTRCRRPRRGSVARRPMAGTTRPTRRTARHASTTSDASTCWARCAPSTWRCTSTAARRPGSAPGDAPAPTS